MLGIDEIKKTAKSSSGFSGGLEDLGKFKEGFCFKIDVADPNDFPWIFCTNDMVEKEDWMDAIYKLVKRVSSGGVSNSLKVEGEVVLQQEEEDALMGEPSAFYE